MSIQRSSSKSGGKNIPNTKKTNSVHIGKIKLPTSGEGNSAGANRAGTNQTDYDQDNNQKQ